MENYFNLPGEIPREILIDLLKSDRVSDSILDWASTQADREIALAILMNPKTSQQHLENLFMAFDTHFELDEFNLTKYYPDSSDSMYKEYQDAWDILENIERHINWEPKETKSQDKNIFYNFEIINYQDKSYGKYLERILNINYTIWTQIITNNYRCSYIYKNICYKLLVKKLGFKTKNSKITKYDKYQQKLQLARETNNFTILKKLLQEKDSNFEIRFAILENHNLSKEIYQEILDYAVERHDCIQKLSSQSFSKAFSKFPKITSSFLSEIAQKPDDTWSFFLAQCPYTPIYVLEKFAQSSDTGLLSKLAMNSSTPEAILLKLVSLNHYDINPALRQNPNLPKSALAKLPVIKPSNWNIASSSTSIDELRKIALTSNDYRIRIRIVLNPIIDVETLKILAKDVDYEVRSRVAENPKTPLTILEELARDKNEQVRHTVLTNPKLTKNNFYSLMRDIYGSCNYSLGCLLALLDPNVSPNILEQNADSLLWNERYIIAIHPKTPRKIIQQLAKDGNIYVRAAPNEHCSKI